MSEKIKQEVSRVIPPGEEIKQIFAVKEDFCAFTEKRIVFVDKKLLGGKKTLTAMPFSKINFVSLKRGGFLSISKEVIIGTGGITLEIDTWDGDQAYTIMQEISKKIG